jgi:alpha-1,2-mannosyltransferase
VQAGLGPGIAYAAQVVVGLGACGALVLVCRRRPEAMAGVLPLAALLTTPFLLAYDLVLLAVPMAWLVRQARAGGGFLPWEKAALAVAYAVPLISLLAARLEVPLGPPAMLALFAAVLRRALR